MQVGETKQITGRPINRRGPTGSRACGGFTLVWALAAIAVLSVGLAEVGPLWADRAKRDRETELLRIGALYAQALARYQQASPGTLKRYPESLTDLLLDARFLNTQRYLRRLYTDPMRPGQAWHLQREDDGTISGVCSASDDTPLRQGPINLGVTVLPSATRYSQWCFSPKSAAPPAAGATTWLQTTSSTRRTS